MAKVRAKFPPALSFLLQKQARYKVAYGGRGAAKSWGFARALLIRAAEQKKRIVCARETQKSIADSVHKLLSDQIASLGLKDCYEIQKAAILGRNGSEFIFAGLKHNIDNIKSLEGADYVWVEEAQSVSKDSWGKLIPTVRKDESEIWVSFNPELDTDDTYQRFVISPPPGAIVVKVNFTDNPWFPKVLADEAAHLQQTDPKSYDHIWGGMCRSTVEGAIYERELRNADLEKRITRVPYDATKPVHTFWDLGWSDAVSIWFAQSIGFEYRIVDYVEDSQRPLSHYLSVLQSRGYVYGTDWLPWDGQAKSLGSGKSIEELMRAAGRRVQIVPRLTVVDGINAARTVFPQCWFDAEKCADGIQGLRHYRWGETSNGIDKREPLHDWASHPADAFRAFAVSIRQPKMPAPVQAQRPRHYVGPWS